MSTPRGKILAIAPREVWPEPLQKLITRGRVQVERVFGLHEAAARLVLESPPFHAVLLDCETLTRNELKMVSVLRRHLNLPIWLLPGPGGRERSIYREALLAGALPLEEAAADFLQDAYTPIGVEGSTVELITKMAKTTEQGTGERQGVAGATDNKGDITPLNRTEIPVTAAVVTRYDEPVSHVHAALSEREVRALLGTAD